jgi:hypothetical protein
MKLTNEQMYEWFRIAAVELLGVAEDSFAKVSEAQGRERSSISGLKQGINDLITMSKHGSVPASLDARLTAAGLPRLGEMRAALSRKETGILKRGVIRNEEEYYIVREVLCDADADLRSKRFERLGRLLAEYESKQQEAQSGSRE